MKLSISNICWDAEHDLEIYESLRKHGYKGLEIAPTRVISSNPYENLYYIKNWADNLKSTYCLDISSMQSIWYGRKERMFGTKEERNILMEYTKKAIDFAEIIGCNNLVFGCPKNRYLLDGANKEEGILFFRELGEYAFIHNTVIGIEANPPIYNTNYINDTKQALELIDQVKSNGIKLNLDVGTMLENNEMLDVIADRVNMINHVHISEPGLSLIKQREIHNELKNVLLRGNYQGYVSIEMGKLKKFEEIYSVLEYVKGVFE